MSKHTPGPWEFVGDGLFGDITTDGKGKKVCRQQIHPFYCEDRGQGLHGQRHEADKRLIAAAPDLLEALASLVSVYDRVGGPLAVDPAVAAARAAIAKATAE